MVRKHARSASYGAAVAAGLANHRGALAGDNGFVHGSDAFHNFAITRNQVASVADHHVARAQRRARAFFHLLAVESLGNDIGLGLAQAVGLRLPARFRHGFGEIREQHREPQPQRDLNPESDLRPAHDNVAHDEDRG